MKIKYKLIIGFMAVSLLAGIVGILSLNANTQIVNSFKSGEEHFGPIIEASGEVSSFAKRAEGHAMLFLTLHNETDRQKFFDRIVSLREQNAILDKKVQNPDARKVLGNIKSKTDELQSTGESLFNAYDYEVNVTGTFKFENYEELMRKLDDIASGIRSDGLELTKIEVDMRTRQEQTAEKNASYLHNIIRIIGIFAIFGSLIIAYVTARNISDPIMKLKEKAIDIGKGSPGTRIEVESKDEVGELTSAFNKMSDDLQKSNNEIISAKEYKDNIVRSMTDSLIVVSPHGIIQTINPSACTVLGYEEKELIGQPISKVLSNNGLKFDKDNYSIKKELILNLETNYLSKDLKKIPIILSASIMNDSDGKTQGIIYVAQDITERKRSREKLQQSEEKYHTLIENIQDGVFIIQDGKMQFVNEAFARVFGYIVEEVMRKDFAELVAPEDLEMAMNRYRRRQAGEDVPKDYELHMMHKDGRTRILVNMNIGLITYHGRVASVGTMKDITEKKKLESQLLLAQRMESVGTLAGGIAHDINNVLTPIMLSQQLLQERLTDEDSQRLLNTIERSTQRGANLMKQIQSFAKGAVGERNVLQMALIISEIREIAEETFPRNIEIRTEIPKDLWTISADATQLNQVIMNLCVNARDAMSNGGILSILAENLLIDEDNAYINAEAKIGPYIVITISDTGTGIPPQVMDRIFEPFFTTKEQGKGTGLGLSISHGIVKSHGGFITVYSEVGKGTAFKVYLPGITTPETLKAQEDQYELPAGRGESILVVDDEDQIREITKRTLQKHGYRVITANNGEEAIALYLQHRDEIKFVLIDMMMPVMDGRACIRELHKINSKIKIIAVSGLTEKDKLTNVADIHVHGFLPKPYTTERLLKTIHEVLSAK